MKKRILLWVSFIIVILICTIYICDKRNRQNQNENKNIIEKIDDENLNIITTNKRLYYMTKTIVKDKHMVDYMFNGNNNEINFKYSKDSLNNISKQDLFIHNDYDIEPWIVDFINKINKGKVGVVNVCRGINLLSYSKKTKYKGFEIKSNPYYWLSLDNYKIALLNIKNGIQDKDPKNRDYYEKNFLEELKKINIMQDKVKKIKSNSQVFNIAYSEEQLEYLIKYSNITATILSANEEVNNTIIDKKSSNGKKIIFLYNNNDEVKKNQKIITKYKIKPIKIQLGDGKNANAEEIINFNFKILETIK